VGVPRKFLASRVNKLKNLPVAKARKQPSRLKKVLSALDESRPDEVRTLLAALHPADIAALLESIPPHQRHPIWELILPDKMGEILLEVSEGVRADLLQEMSAEKLVAAARTLDIDDIADLIPDLPDEVIAEILFAMDKQDRQRLDTVLSYPQDTAGGLMNLDTVTVRENLTVEVVLRYLRRRGELPEHTNNLFVVDREDRLIGSLSLSKLLTADGPQRVSQLMLRDPVKFSALTPAGEVAGAFERYNLVTAPVVDETGKLIGRITVDDVVDVIREQADHTVMARAGLSEEEDIFAPVARSIKNRALWMGINLLTAFLASWVIGVFEHTINQLVALAVLMPIVASMGGNAGTQTSTIVIRGIALGQISGINIFRVLIKELSVGFLNGLIWAVVVGTVAYVAYGTYMLGIIIGAAMIINLLAAALAGVLLPLLLRKFGTDPALTTTVALTTVTDVVGFFSFLGLATLFLL
jgi:magnesium transporter